MSFSPRTWFSVGTPMIAALLWAGQASADPAGEKVLADMDSAMNRAKTQFVEFEATNQESGKADRKLGLQVFIKGEKRLTEFLSPADMKGTKVLILSTTNMFVYLPAFGKVRRIASHATDQGFMGLAFSQDDFASQSYSGQYTAQLLSETGSEWVIQATPKAGQSPAYAKIAFTVAKDRTLPTKLDYYNADGKMVKTETRSGYTCEGNVCTPTTLKMVDLTKNISTTMVRKAWKVNETISDDVFSKRNLEK